MSLVVVFSNDLSNTCWSFVFIDVVERFTGNLFLYFAVLWEPLFLSGTFRCSVFRSLPLSANVGLLFVRWIVALLTFALDLRRLVMKGVHAFTLLHSRSPFVAPTMYWLFGVNVPSSSVNNRRL